MVEDSNDSLLETQSSQSAQSMHLLGNSIFENDPEFAEILIMNQDIVESRREVEIGEELTSRHDTTRTSMKIGDETDSDDELSSSGDEISVSSRSSESSIEESSGEEGVDKITCPYVEKKRFI